MTWGALGGRYSVGLFGTAGQVLQRNEIPQAERHRAPATATWRLLARWTEGACQPDVRKGGGPCFAARKRIHIETDHLTQQIGGIAQNETHHSARLSRPGWGCFAQTAGIEAISDQIGCTWAFIAAAAEIGGIR